MYEFVSVQPSSYKIHKLWHSHDTISEIRNVGWGVWKMLEVMVWRLPEIITSAYLTLSSLR